MAERGSLRAGVADALRDDLARGRFGPGDRLPAEAALARRFALNRHTVRDTLARLAAEGLVISRRGAGSFVASRPTDYPLGRRVRFEANLRAAGRTPAREVLALLTRAADEGEAAALGLEARRTRRRGRPEAGPAPPEPGPAGARRRAARPPSG